MRTLLILFLTGIFLSTAYSQSEVGVNDVRNIFDEKGDYYFDRKEYKKAIVYYNMAFDKDANNYYSVLRKAKAYERMGLYDQAAESYRILFDTKLYIPNEHRLDAALLMLGNKDISGFEERMREYNEIVYSEIHGYLSDADVRAKMYKDSSLLIVENENILNTPESEIAPMAYKGKLVFASTRKNLAAYGANSFYNFFSASYLEGGQLGRLNKYNESLNSKHSESSIAFSAATKQLYFTRGSFSGKLKSYSAPIPSGVQDALKVEEVRMEGMNNIGHISFNTNGTSMYFVAEASGGSGGLDIYTSKYENGKWSKPENLGTGVNSAKDEMYPFVLNDTLLFFSSAGHASLGGLDLFSASLNNPDASPANLGNKVNSAYDDYSLSFSTGGLTGYFCSNRPGGFGKEDIYRLHMMDIKVKLAAYKFKRRTTMEEDKINLYLSSGEEYNIAAEGNSGFNFSFRPEEPYKMLILHENATATDIMYNTGLNADQRKKQFLKPKPIEKTEIRLDPGVKYQFTAGMQAIGKDYKSKLNDMAQDYQGAGGSTIDLTALAKELFLREGEVYSIRFVPDEDRYFDGKSKEETSLYVNNQELEVGGNSFFIVLPLDIEANFNIKTDIDHFKDKFNPKKTGAVKVDAAPVMKEKPVEAAEGFPILVNTDSFDEVVKGRAIKATELTIIPGSMYILTFDRTNASVEDQGVVIPLTKGVKYNLGTENESQEAYMKALAQMSAGAENESGELIDISVLSKELDISGDRDIVFSLTPAKQFGQQESGRNVVTTLAVDGRKYYITKMQKLQVNLKLPATATVNIQTDLSYVKENFDASTIALKVDTTSISKDIEEAEKDEISDPVFDVITINFDLNDYTIRPDAKTILADEVVQVLKGDKRLYVTIKGYTDPLGDAAYNEKLSRNRAQVVKDFLSNNGIGESRIRTFSFGETLSLNPGQNWEEMSEAELQKHRKVEIVLYLPK